MSLVKLLVAERSCSVVETGLCTDRIEYSQWLYVGVGVKGTHESVAIDSENNIVWFIVYSGICSGCTVYDITQAVETPSHHMTLSQVGMVLRQCLASESLGQMTQ